MSRSRRTLLSTLMLSAAMSAGGALPAVRSLAAQAAPAATDFGKLSPAGRRAMQDVSVARGALFDGKTDEAARLVHDARVRFDQARGDDTAILRPEAGLAPSPELRADASPVRLVALPLHDRQVIAWLPYDGEVVLLDSPDTGSTHDATQARKATAVAAANAALSSGRRAEALHLLSLAGVGVDCTLDIVPLEATVRRIGQADSLMQAGRYYEAGRMLHRIERSARRERMDIGAAARSVDTRQVG